MFVKGSNMNNQEGSSSPRVARRRARTRERILSTATSLFAARGIDQVTLTDITDEADVSRGNLYSHFYSKEDLVVAVYQPAMEYSLEQMRRVHGLPPAEAIEIILRVHTEVWRKFPGTLLVMYQLKDAEIEGMGSGHDRQTQDVLSVFRQAADMNLLRMEPELALNIVDTISVPFLELAQEAPDPDAFFVESMLRILLKE
jgi:AcrR family transcriptional regulator